MKSVRLPVHCGERMLDVTEADDRRLGVRVWICSVCKLEYEEADPDGPPPKKPRRPTAAQPGTEAKLRVLEARAAAGQALFRDDDAPLAGLQRDNGAQAPSPHDGTSGGVCPDRRLRGITRCMSVRNSGSFWMVRVGSGPARRYVGQYPTLQEAVRARDAAEAEMGAAGGPSQGRANAAS